LVDEYRPVAAVLPLLDWVLEWYLRGIRHDLVRLLAGRGVRTALDVGCGTGALARLLADAGISTVCMDPSSTMLSLAGRRAGSPPRFRVLAGSAEQLPFGREFDAVVFSLVLHELDTEQRELAWREAHRVLQPGGVVVVVEFTRPGRGGLAARLGGTLIRFIERQAGRIHPPHYAGYRELMDAGGFAAWLRVRAAHVLEERRYFWGNIGLFAVAARTE